MFMTRFQSYLILVGRVFFCAVFVGCALHKLTHFASTREYMVAHGMPDKPLLLSTLLGLAIFLELSGSLLIIVGLKVQFGALFLIAFLVPATTIFHGFWNFTPEAQLAQMAPEDQALLEAPELRDLWKTQLANAYDRQMNQFMRNLAIVGGLLILMAFGAGPISLDAKWGDGTGIPFRDQYGLPL